MATEAKLVSRDLKGPEVTQEKEELTRKEPKATEDLMQMMDNRDHPALMGYLVIKVDKSLSFYIPSNVPNYFFLSGYSGLDGTYGRDGEKGFKGSKGERSDLHEWCKGAKGEEGTIVFLSKRNATTVIRGKNGTDGAKGQRGDDGIHGTTGY